MATNADQSQSVRRQPRRRCNELDGKRWLQNSISVWSDVRKTAEETQLKHPAMFPVMLAERLIETFLSPDGQIVLDPFAGSGSTVLAAQRRGKRGIGLEISPEYVELGKRRLKGKGSRVEDPESTKPTGGGHRPQGGRVPPVATGGLCGPTNLESCIHEASAAELLKYVLPESVDLCITSPPYWNILNQRRTADLKAVRHYGNLQGDLGAIEDYEEYLDAVTAVFQDVLVTLKPKAYCCVIVMDLRKKSRFFPLHSDLAERLVAAGFLYDDLIIWNRQAEYNNLRPLGYPSVFRVNKVHEFVLVMQKPHT